MCVLYHQRLSALSSQTIVIVGAVVATPAVVHLRVWSTIGIPHIATCVSALGVVPSHVVPRGTDVAVAVNVVEV